MNRWRRPGECGPSAVQTGSDKEETMDGTTSRATFLSRGAKGGLALVAGGSVLAATSGSALANLGDSKTSDADIAKLAATAELLALDFYTRCIASKKFTGDKLAYLAAARS